MEWFCPDCKNRAKSTLSYKLDYSIAHTPGTAAGATPCTSPMKANKPDGGGSKASPWKPLPDVPRAQAPRVIKQIPKIPVGWMRPKGNESNNVWVLKSGRKKNFRQRNASQKSHNQLEHLVRDLINKVDTISNLQKRYEHNLGRTKNILIYAPEPEIKEAASRHAAERAVALQVLRSSGVTPLPRWTKIHRVGKWTANQSSSRPLLLGFRSMQDRDRILSKAAIIKAALPNIEIQSDVGNTGQRKRIPPRLPEDFPVLDSTVIQVPRVQNTEYLPVASTPSPRLARSSSVPALSKNGQGWASQPN